MSNTSCVLSSKSQIEYYIIMNLPVVPKKSLGQNFLNSTRVLTRIVEATDLKTDETIIEIGPGLGALTEMLLKSSKKVVAIEKDDTLYSILLEKFANEIKKGSLLLIHKDIQDFDPKTLKLPKGSVYKIAANIPYNITGIIIRQFLTTEFQPEKMVLLIQKEVATRILAKDKKESLLSLSVKAYGEPKLVTHVARGNFNPVPNVDSSVIEINAISRKYFKNHDVENLFFKIIHAGFGHKRKMLIKNMLDEKIGTREQWEQVLQQRKLSLSIRSEDLTIDDWIFITNVLYNNK